MATTYDRINIALRRLKRRVSWDLTELAESIREGEPRPEAFRIRGDGTSLDDYMKVSSIRRLLTLLVSLELAESLPENKIRINNAGSNCLQSDDHFANQVKASVTTLLHKGGIELEDLRNAIKQTRLPDMPDADTIFVKVVDNAQKSGKEVTIDADRFRTMMYLLAIAKGVDRVVRVYYRFDDHV
ncbi:hypothetical protein [Mycolicibacterium nivoides]|uniref:Uncharacterized protein n=1 Tax=Mycolicibacterium nivoides TaxID=2487344 RepID=A0ABW9L946_9MYCO